MAFMAFTAGDRLYSVTPLAHNMKRTLLRRRRNAELGPIGPLLDVLGDYDVRDRLWGVNCPVVVVTGGADLVAPPSRARRVARALPDADLPLEATSPAGSGSATGRSVESTHL